MTRTVLTFVAALLFALPALAQQPPGPPDKPGDQPKPGGEGQPAKPKDPVWKQELKQKLKRKVTLDFSGTPLPDVLQFMQETTKASIVLDGDSKLAEEQVDLRVEQLEVSSALKLILQLKRATMAIKCGVVVCGRKPLVDAYPDDTPPPPVVEGGKPVDLTNYKKLQTKRITLDFTETPFADVMAFINQVTQANVGVEKGLLATAPPVTLALRNHDVAQTLTLLAHLAGGKLIYTRAGTWDIVARPKPKVEPKPPAGEGDGGEDAPAPPEPPKKPERPDGK